MMKCSAWARVVALSALAAATAHGALVWPTPQKMVNGSTTVLLSPYFTISCAAGNVCPDPLPAAFSRYSNILFFAGPAAAVGSTPAITSLTVKVSTTADLALGVAENYTLSVPAGGAASITAINQWGALRALESFSQLFTWSAGTAGANVYTLDAAPVNIVDFPRFQWRGVLIDSSRHYLTMPAILSTLDAMSYVKMNRLHWHVVDDNSWPLYSQTYPNFTIGAYAPDAIYTHADVEEIVQYAYERGISIVPEFDGPAHASAWGKGYPDLVISCPNGQTLLDPTDDGQVYNTLQGLLNEFVPLFKTDFIHFGGDEVEDYVCWQQSPKVAAFMTRMNYTTMFEVRNYFETRLQNMAKAMQLSSMFWEEVYDQGFALQPSSIVDVWLSDEELINVIKGGNRVVESYGLYLDQQLPPGGNNYFWVDTVKNFWLHDPLFNASVTPEQAALVLGMSASQWGEQVDATNIHSRMWPRACGSAERMWSDMNLRDTTDLFVRLTAVRCHMAQRGIGAGPIRPSDQVGYCPLPRTSRFQHMPAVF